MNRHLDVFFTSLVSTQNKKKTARVGRGFAVERDFFVLALEIVENSRKKYTLQNNWKCMPSEQEINVKCVDKSDKKRKQTN